MDWAVVVSLFAAVLTAIAELFTYRQKRSQAERFEGAQTGHGARLLRPGFRNERPRPGARLLKPLRQIIESVNDTLKGQLDLERHGGRTCGGVAARVPQRVLALTAAIWHNAHTAQPTLQPLVAYDQCPRELVIQGAPPTRPALGIGYATPLQIRRRAPAGGAPGS